MKTILITDNKIPLKGNIDVIIFWSDFIFNNSENKISLPNYVEKNAKSLKSRYLKWVNDKGETIYNGKSIIDFLNLPEFPSYWWMTSIGQRKNIHDKSQINNVIKVFALHEILSELDEDCLIEFDLKNSSLKKVLYNYCENQQIKYINQNKIVDKYHLLVSKIKLISLPLIAIFYWIWYIKYVFQSYYINAFLTSYNEINKGYVFFDLLTYLKPESFKSGDFNSNYWGSLIDLINSENLSVNFIHSYYYSKQIPNLVVAHKLLNRFKLKNKNQNHFLIETVLNFKLYFKILSIYLILFKKSLIFSKHFFEYDDGLKVDLVHLLNINFYDTLIGKEAIKNCIRIILTNYKISKFSNQKSAFYLMENQPWELATVTFWKSKMKSPIFAVPHTIIKFWDLRYFYFKDTYLKKDSLKAVFPDKIIVNSPVTFRNYCDSGYYPNSIIKAEALRFLYHYTKTIPLKENSNKLLFCGDYLQTTNDKMMNILKEAISIIKFPIQIYVKSHPANPIKINDYTFFKYEIIDLPLNILMPKFKYVYTSNVSSISVDAYLNYKHVIQILDGDYFNLSPLKEMSNGVSFITNSKELASLINNKKQNKIKDRVYFYNDNSLPKWKKILKLNY